MVPFNYLAFDVHAPENNIPQIFPQILKEGVAGKQPEESGVPDTSVLDHFTHAVLPEPLRQSVKDCGVNEHQ